MYCLCFSMWLCQHQSSPLNCISLLTAFPLGLFSSPPCYSGLFNIFRSSAYPFLSSPHKSYVSLHFSFHAAPLWRRKFNSLINSNCQRIFFICHSLFTLKNTVLVNLHPLCNKEDHDPVLPLQLWLHPSVCCLLPSGSQYCHLPFKAAFSALVICSAVKLLASTCECMGGFLMVLCVGRDSP